MKVCFILPKLHISGNGVIIGGYAVNAVTLAMELERLGIEIEILAAMPAGTECLLASHPARRLIKSVPLVGRGLIDRGVISLTKLTARLKKEVASGSHNIIHSHSGAFIYAAIPCLASGGKTTKKVHSLYCPIGAKGGMWGKWFENPQIARSILNGLDGVVAVTNNIFDSIKNAGVRKPEIDIIPMSVDLERFRRKPDDNSSKFFPGDTKGRRILFVGNSSREKGLEGLIKAIHLLVCEGQTPYLVAALENQSGIREYDDGQKRSEELIKKLNLEHLVRVIGVQQKIEDLYGEADIIVIPWNSTKGPSDYPMVALEGMAMGKCVVSTPVGGCPELLKYGQAGVLSEGFMPEQIAGAIRHILVDPGLKDRLGQEGKCAVENLSVKTAARKMIGFYDRLLCE